MDDKRTALGIFLIILVVMVYSQLVLSPYSTPRGPGAIPTPQTEKQVVEEFSQPSSRLSQATSSPSHDATNQTNQQELARPPSGEELRKHPIITIESSKVKFMISSLGARIMGLSLKEYREHAGSENALNLVSYVEGNRLPLGAYFGSQNDEHLIYTLDSENNNTNFLVTENSELALHFKTTLNQDVTLHKKFKFYPNSYFFNVDLELSTSQPPPEIWLEWGHHLPAHLLQEQLKLNPMQFTLLSSSNKIQRIPLAEASNMSTPFTSIWVGLADKYFTTTIIPISKPESAPAQNTRLGKDGDLYWERATSGKNMASFTVYAGPKEYQTLQKVGYQLEREVDLGFFSFLAYPLLLLIRFLFKLLGNYGLSIIGVTLLIKFLFLPLTRASLKSMQAMQELQPEVQALRARIKDATQLNQEMLALYKKRGVNPMGGCLPMLIQIPVFFGLYSALQNAIELRHAPFALWIGDLSSPEHLDLWGINVPVMILLMGFTMFVQQYTTPSPTLDPTQRKMMLGMSGVFTLMFIIFPFPAGLALYMLVNTLISLVQQAYLKSDKKANPYVATLLASVCIFSFGFILTLLD